jgi:RNA polymerase sigma-70 factor, ECF subfamily
MSEINKQFSLEALKKGDPQEYSRLVEETSPQVYRIILRILGDSQDAEDILQETYIKAFKSFPEFEGRSSVTTWLYRIAVNEALMLIRRKKPDAISLEDSDDDEQPIPEKLKIVGWHNLPEGELLSKEARHFMDIAVQRLSPALKTVFIMRDLEDFSILETAKTLGITENSVKTRLSRARLILRDELSHYYSERAPKETKNG